VLAVAPIVAGAAGVWCAIPFARVSVVVVLVGMWIVLVVAVVWPRSSACG
jgi:hypothetical protein